MRKYKASVAAVSTDQITIQDQQTTIQVHMRAVLQKPRNLEFQQAEIFADNLVIFADNFDIF